MTERIPDEDLLADLRAVADDLGHPPTRNEYDGHGSFHNRTFHSHFGSWDAALEAAGLDPDDKPAPTRPKHIPDEELLFDLRIGAHALGRPPNSGEYVRFGEHSHVTILKRFGSWEAALREAGLDPDERTDARRSDLPPKAAVVRSVRRVAADLQKTPTWVEYRNHDDGYHSKVVYQHFESWRDALVAARLIRPREDPDS